MPDEEHFHTWKRESKVFAHWVFGYEEFRQFHDILLSSYVIYDFTNLWKLPRDLEKTMEFNQYLRTGFIDYRWDEKCYMENYPTDKVDKCTTGFRTIFMMRQKYPSANITLVNFGVKDDRFRKTATHHGIEYEDSVLTEMKFNRLYI